MNGSDLFGRIVKAAVVVALYAFFFIGAVVLITGCGADDELRYPGAPVLDLIYEDEKDDHFIAAIVASEPSPDTLGIMFRLTFRGYLTTHDREPFERTTKYITSMVKGRRHQTVYFRKEICSFWDRYYGLELDRPGLRPYTIAAVTSLTVEMYPFAFDDRSPIFNVDVGKLTMVSTIEPHSLSE